jgi:IMP dehydrogenase
MTVNLAFGDVMIEPNYSDIEHRTEIDITSRFLGMDLKVPIISANMSSITEWKMARAMLDAGAFYVFHRFFDDPHKGVIRQINQMGRGPYSISVGIRNSDDELRFVEVLLAQGFTPIVTIDTAHGDHKRVVDLIKAMKDIGVPYVIAGNVATGHGYARLAESGADAVKVGIGGGSICTTRETTGVGTPQLSGVLKAADWRRRANLTALIISDGGHKTTGDIVKALVAGADAVMLGSMLAGTDETPGEVRIGTDGKEYKTYNGSSIFGTNRTLYTVEGVEGFAKRQGPVANVVKNIAGGIISACGYVGARSLVDLRERARFVEVTPSSHIESGTRVRTSI